MKGINQIYKDKLTFFSLIVICIVLVAALSSKISGSTLFIEQDLAHRLESPSVRHWFGTDALGRDLLSRVLFGAQVSMAVGLITAAMSLVIGTFVGAMAGYFGGWIDLILMRVVDIFYVFPSLLVAILVTLFAGNRLGGIVFAIGIVSWTNVARVVRSSIMQIKQLQHVEAATAVGAGTFDILRKHVMPLVLGPLIVVLTYQIPSNVVAESFLSFVGLGLQPPLTSWGTLAAEGWRAARSYPHLIFFPGLILVITLLAFQLLGDGLRDRFDPVSRRMSE